MSKKPSLSAALHEASGKQPLIRATPSADTTPASVQDSALPPSRRGKKIISAHFDPAVSKQLKQLALENDTTVQALMATGPHGRGT
jgi:hypothetical protein